MPKWALVAYGLQALLVIFLLMIAHDYRYDRISRCCPRRLKWHLQSGARAFLSEIACLGP